MEKRSSCYFVCIFFGEATNESWFVLWEILPYFCVCGLAENWKIKSIARILCSGHFQLSRNFPIMIPRGKWKSGAQNPCNTNCLFVCVMFAHRAIKLSFNLIIQKKGCWFSHTVRRKSCQYTLRHSTITSNQSRSIPFKPYLQQKKLGKPRVKWIYFNPRFEYRHIHHKIHHSLNTSIIS